MNNERAMIFSTLSSRVIDVVEQFKKNEQKHGRDYARYKFADTQERAIGVLNYISARDRTKYMAAYVHLLALYNAFLIIEFMPDEEGTFRVEFLSRDDKRSGESDNSGRGDQASE